MKKLSFLFVIAALVVACSPQKQVAYQPTSQQPAAQESDVQKQIRETKEQAELLKAQNELELLKIQQEQAVAALREQATLEAGAQKLLIPCTKEALELEQTNQMAAQGMATGKTIQEDALIDANENAIAELTSRWVGVIKHGMERYTKDTRTKSLSREQESQLEGLCINTCEKAIHKYFKPACREFLKDKKGGYGCYVALYVSTKDVLNEIDKAMEVAEVDVDKAIFRKRLQEELDAQSRKEQEAKQADLERLKALQGQTGE
ncbi:MAG: hypothetical protein IJT04_04320 [Bacteroidales bacterium]|nr:hypothetical protein [Bacteroidales bacterium]